jgi:hypothetical protein
MSAISLKTPDYRRLAFNVADKDGHTGLFNACQDFVQLQRPNRVQIEKFKQQFYGSISSADQSGRRKIANVVADFEFVPRSILLFLALDEPSVAAPVISRSQVLGQFDLMQLIDKKGSVHQRLIACRPDIGPSVITKLIGCNDQLVARRLLDNTKVELTAEQTRSLEAITAKTTTLTRPSREDAPSVAAKTTSQTQAVSEPESVSTHIGVTDAAVAELLELANRGGRLKSNPQSPPAAVSDPQQDHAFHNTMLDAATRKDRQDQVAALGARFGFSPETCHAVFADNSGDTLAITLKASAMPQNQAVGAIMLSIPHIGLSVHNMMRISDIYAGLEARTCREATTSWRDSTPGEIAASTARYVPQTEDEKPGLLRRVFRSSRFGRRSTITVDAGNRTAATGT